MAKISPKHIAEAIYTATTGKTGNDLAFILQCSVKMLQKKKMLNKSSEVLSALQNIFDKKTNTIRVKVFTAKNIVQDGKKKLENEIKDKYKAEKVISEFFEDKELLGGMRVEVGDEVLDNTYRNKLHQLENFLIQGK